MVRRGFELLCNEVFAPRNRRTSYPLRKALIMLFRGELNVELKPKDESSWKEVFGWFKNTMPKLIDVLTNYKSEINKI